MSNLNKSEFKKSSEKWAQTALSLKRQEFLTLERGINYKDISNIVHFMGIFLSCDSGVAVLWSHFLKKYVSKKSAMMWEEKSS